MKVIWILDHYSSEPQYGGISRQYDFALELSRRGYKVIVVSSGFSHYTHTYISEKDIFVSKVNENVTYIYLKTSEYKSNGGLKRIKNMFSFIMQIFRHNKLLVRKFGKPDVVTGCSVHPLTWIPAYRISKKYDCRYCMEVRDLWPEVWILNGDKSKWNPMVIFFRLLEKWSSKRADKIIYSMSYGDRYFEDVLHVDKQKLALIGQPMDMERFDRNVIEKENLLPREIKEFVEKSFCCIFAGYYMEYEGVYTMLHVAKRLQEECIDVKMLFVGSGEEYEGMKTYAQTNMLRNVLIWERIPKEAIPSLLAKANICMAQLAHRGHPNAYKYGVSKNKVNEYLYSGACTLYGFMYKDDEVTKSGAGYIYEPYNEDELFQYIKLIYEMPVEKQKEFGIKGREYIKVTHSVEVLTSKLESALFT